MKQLSENVFVSPQIKPADISAYAAQGIEIIINNRPDNEMIGQPDSAEIEAACNAAGIDYIHIPMARQISEDQVAKSQAAFSGAKGNVLAFCASGTRSTVLWCCAHVSELGVDSVLEAAENAGYNLGHIRPMLSSLLDKNGDS